jgi:hypothetical protein
MTPFVLAILLTAIGASGIVIGRAWERRAWAAARPGYLIQPATPVEVMDRWNFPTAPVYDYEADELFAEAVAQARDEWGKAS